MNLPVLSIRQPWASAIVFGFKDIENRTWETPFRGRFLVHATRWKNEREFEAAFEFLRERIDFDHMQMLCGGSPHAPDGHLREFGQIIGEARITSCVSSSPSPWFEGPFGFVLSDAKRFTPIAAKGRLGFWNFDLPEGHR